MNPVLQPIQVKRHPHWLYLASFDREGAAERREQECVVTKVELHDKQASVPPRKVVAVVRRADTHLSDTNPLCLRSQSS